MIKNVDPSEVNGGRQTIVNRACDDLAEFIRGDGTVGEVDVGEYKNAASAVSAMRYAIFMRKIAGIKVVRRGDRVFVIKKKEEFKC